jgi:UDP-2,4-diacetamido-2,4,6-trideoxy-beta-L-altropyranose hydrolase
MRIVLRATTPDDAERLLAWRNDPVTRANSRRQQILDWAELSRVPDGITRETYIGEHDGEAVGTVRLDYAADACELSWTVARVGRGRGLGHALAHAAIASPRRPKLVAAIKSDNDASRRIAQRLGFVQDGMQDGLERWRLTKA